MADSRLNSVHLETRRRKEFRKARDVLLHSRGQETCMAELAVGPNSDSKTRIHKLQDRIPPGVDFVLLDKESVFHLKVGVNTIGRLPDNDIILADPFISRRHCAILIHANKACELHDVASKNGTFVNGQPLSGPTQLSSGDEIRLCDRQFVFVRKSDPPPSVSSSEKTHAD